MFLRFLSVWTIIMCLASPVAAWYGPQKEGCSQEGVMEQFDEKTGQVVVKARIKVEVKVSGKDVGMYKDKLLALKVADPQMKAKISLFKPGDRIVFEYAVQRGDRVLKSILVKREPVAAAILFFVVFCTAAFLMGLTAVFLNGRVLHLVVGEDNRYSNSKFQMVVWFSVLMLSYVVLAILRIWYGGAEFAGGIEIPQSLLILSGLTAFTFAGAKGIIKSKKEKHDLGAGQAGVPPEPFKKPGEGPPKLSQLVEDDNQRVDVGDFQLLMLTLIAAGMYVVQAWEVFRVIELHRTVSLPDVDPTFLAIFGIGQGMYLVKKQLGETPAAGPKDGEDSAAKPPKQPSDGGK